MPSKKGLFGVCICALNSVLLLIAFQLFGERNLLSQSNSNKELSHKNTTIVGTIMIVHILVGKL